MLRIFFELAGVTLYDTYGSHLTGYYNTAGDTNCPKSNHH